MPFRHMFLMNKEVFIIKIWEFQCYFCYIFVYCKRGVSWRLIIDWHLAVLCKIDWPLCLKLSEYQKKFGPLIIFYVLIFRILLIDQFCLASQNEFVRDQKGMLLEMV